MNVAGGTSVTLGFIDVKGTDRQFYDQLIESIQAWAKKTVLA